MLVLCPPTTLSPGVGLSERSPWRRGTEEGESGRQSPKQQWRIVLRIYQAREAEAMKDSSSENLASHERRETEPDRVAINNLGLGLS